MRLNHLTRVAALSAALGFVAAPARADVPESLPYQGWLADAANTPVNGQIDLTFKLYLAAGDAEPVWTESLHGVEVVDGIFFTYLGETVPLLAFFGDGTTR